MKQKIIILTKWKGKEALLQKEAEIEKCFGDQYEYKYLVELQKKKERQEITITDSVIPLLKRDFSIFGRLKKQQIKELLQNDAAVLLIDDASYKITKLILKNSTNLSVGRETEKAYQFNISIKGENLKDINLYNKINEILNKIK